MIPFRVLLFTNDENSKKKPGRYLIGIWNWYGRYAILFEPFLVRHIPILKKYPICSVLLVNSLPPPHLLSSERSEIAEETNILHTSASNVVLFFGARKFNLLLEILWMYIYEIIFAARLTRYYVYPTTERSNLQKRKNTVTNHSQITLILL